MKPNKSGFVINIKSRQNIDKNKNGKKWRQIFTCTRPISGGRNRLDVSDPNPIDPDPRESEIEGPEPEVS
jgi:hypothetical protein